MYQLKNIKNLDINSFSLEELASKFFHFCGDQFLSVYDSIGMSPQIGSNSIGLDEKPSIFFSMGVEGVLELWDVWLKWKTNKIFTPQNKSNATMKEITKWHNYFSSGEFLYNDELLNAVFDVMIEEMKSNSYYLLELKENEDFVSNQIDGKKVRGKDNPMVRMMYGKYSDFSTPVADKWNMQTIPGKELTISPNRIVRLNTNGKTDLLSIIVNLYERYKNETKNPQSFFILDKFVNYVKDTEKKL